MVNGKITTKLRSNKSQNISVVLLLLMTFLVQAYVASWPDIVGDVRVYRFWSRTLVNEGLASAYWNSPTLKELGWTVDYPPIYPYILYGIGKVHKFFSPESFETNGALLDFFVKLPAIFSNIIISLLIFIFLKGKTGFKTAFLVMSAYALNPAIIFDTSRWGQTDAINSLFVLLSIICLSNKKPELAWVSITLGVFMKPLAYPFVPMVALFTLKQFGTKRTLRCALAAVIAIVVIFLPFVYINRLSDIIYSLFFQLDVMPYVSLNAHNIWWVIGGGLPWVHVDIKPFGFISYRLIGIALFSVFYLVSLLKFWGPKYGEDKLYYLSASVAFGFFMLSTHIHENHFFTFFPLLSMIYFYDKRLKWIYIILTFTFLANMVLHDPLIASVGLFRTGKILEIPIEIGDDLWLLGFLMTVLNAQINILIFCYWTYCIYFRKETSFNLKAFEKSVKLGQLSLLKIAAMIILFVSLTSVPFIVKIDHLKKEQYFIQKSDSADIKAIKDNYVNSSLFDINNDIRTVLFEHPPSQITYKVTLPERAFLSFGIGLDSRTWNADKGDGVLFELHVQDGGMPEKVFSKYIDPKHNVADRKWHDEVVDLSRYSGRPVSLSFVTTPGFNYDGNFDWAGWSNPKIVTNNKELKNGLVK